jgi:heme-degrading monooxygenase HmoA
MFAVLSKFAVNNGGAMTASVKSAFQDRPHLVDHSSGFVRMDVLSPLDNPDEIWLLTYWTDRSSFEEWYRTHRFKEAHCGIPSGLKLMRDSTDMVYLDHIAS